MRDPTQESRPSNPNLLEGFLTREQLATALGKSVRTLDRWEVLRMGPPRVILGKTILFRIEAVRDWLASIEQPPHRKAPRLRKLAGQGRAGDARLRRGSPTQASRRAS